MTELAYHHLFVVMLLAVHGVGPGVTEGVLVAAGFPGRGRPPGPQPGVRHAPPARTALQHHSAPPLLGHRGALGEGWAFLHSLTIIVVVCLILLTHFLGLLLSGRVDSPQTGSLGEPLKLLHLLLLVDILLAKVHSKSHGFGSSVDEVHVHWVCVTTGNLIIHLEESFKIIIIKIGSQFTKELDRSPNWVNFHLWYHLFIIFKEESTNKRLQNKNNYFCPIALDGA